MSGIVSRLYREAEVKRIALEKALEDQFGSDWPKFRYQLANDNSKTAKARREQLIAVKAWNDAALAKP